MTQTQYTDRTTLELQLSEMGVELRTDDVPLDDDAVNLAIDFGSSIIDEYCGLKYLPTQLSQSMVVKRWATVLALYELCTRRNEAAPGSVKEKRDEVIDRLKQIESGTVAIPGLARARSAVPTVTNQRVVLDRYPAVRTETPRSTGEAAGYTRRTDDTAPGAVR